MRRTISTPIAMAVIVVAALALGALVWHRASQAGTTTDVSDVARQIQSTRTDLPVIPKEQILQHAAGGRPGLSSRR